MPTPHWLNDEEARKTSSRIPYRLLEADTKLSYGDSETENMLIQGDNLEALKALLPYYAGQVKCIYIDPPYNTENAFTDYDDNLEHSIWLSTIYPRLELLWNFIKEDGSIWISIDDKESHYMKVITDELFGRDKFIPSIVWQNVILVKIEKQLAIFMIIFLVVLWVLVGYFPFGARIARVFAEFSVHLCTPPH